MHALLDAVLLVLVLLGLGAVVVLILSTCADLLEIYRERSH